MRIKIIITITSIALFCGCNTNKEVIDLSCQDCNVIFLDIDLLRADYVGLIRPDYNVTPNIDSFFLCLYLQTNSCFSRSKKDKYLPLPPMK